VIARPAVKAVEAVWPELDLVCAWTHGNQRSKDCQIYRLAHPPIPAALVGLETITHGRIARVNERSDVRQQMVPVC